MRNEMQKAPASGVVRDFPRAPNRGDLTLREIINAIMASSHADEPQDPVERRKRAQSVPSRESAYAYRALQLGDLRLSEITTDIIADALARYTAEPVLGGVGKDADGKPILRDYGARSKATVNRQRTYLAGILSWVQVRRRSRGT